MTRPNPPDIPLAADEATTLDAFLDFYRAELLDRAWGLDHEQLNRTLPPSTLSLARLIGHMTYVELSWFCERFDGEPEPDGTPDFDWEADPDAEMTRAETLPPEQLVAEFESSCADSRRRVAAADSLDQLSTATNPAGERTTLRWIVVHMIEEYARHCGHADLIRESIDGDLAR
ncbi:MAG: DinB family protein [Ilumatobacter sp.]|uniref:DinB family protein n=1 Tax=Ilumatobacter sp. TaxID=1967498 RepID=UPI003C72B685